MAVTAVMQRCAKLGKKCVHLGHSSLGDEANSLTPLHAFCAAHGPDASVAYMHNKGSFTDNPENARLRKVLLRGLSSKPCADAIVSGSDQCDVCSMRFSPVPHQHTSGNMWLARCDYVRLLREPRDFRRRMNHHWNWTDNANANRGARLGVGRFAYEHWVHSHPVVRPCDVLDHQFHYGYSDLPPENYKIRFSMAPRYQPGHPFYKFGTMGGSPCGLKERSTLGAVLSEWADIYDATPPEDSLLLAHYTSTPPDETSVKLRQHIEHDAGSAFQRWARRRGKGD